MSIFRTTRPSVKEVSMAFGARWAWVQIPTSPFTSCVTLRNFFNLFILYFIIYKIDTNNAYLSMFVRFLREPSLCLSHKYPINSYFLSLSFPAPIFSITCQREINCGFPESTCVSGEHTWVFIFLLSKVWSIMGEGVLQVSGSPQFPGPLPRSTEPPSPCTVEGRKSLGVTGSQAHHCV